MIESDWDDYLDEYNIEYPFHGRLKAIKIREDDVDNELLTQCVEKHIVSKVSKGHFITHEDLEQHLKDIKEHGMEAYLEKRLELVEDE